VTYINKPIKLVFERLSFDISDLNSRTSTFVDMEYIKQHRQLARLEA